jgi:drug/metabolite transporter (DMT)-like permease
LSTLNTPLKTPWLAYVSLLSGMLLVGTYVGLSKPLTAAIPVLVLALLRFFLAALMMVHWVAGPPLTRATWLTLIVQSFFGNFLFSICMLYGVKLSSAVSAGLVMSTLPAVVAVFSMLFLREHMNLRAWLAIGVSVLGVALLTIASTSTHSGASSAALPSSVWFGHALLLVAVSCEAVYVVTGKRLTNVITPSRNSALVNLLGFCLILPFGLWEYFNTDFALSHLSAGTWALLIFYAFAASMGSVWLWMTGLRHVPASRAGVFSLGLPVAAVAVGVFVLNEPLTLMHGVAFAACACAIYLITSAPFRADPTAGAN